MCYTVTWKPPCNILEHVQAMEHTCHAVKNGNLCSGRKGVVTFRTAYCSHCNTDDPSTRYSTFGEPYSLPGQSHSGQGTGNGHSSGQSSVQQGGRGPLQSSQQQKQSASRSLSDIRGHPSQPWADSRELEGGDGKLSRAQGCKPQLTNNVQDLYLRFDNPTFEGDSIKWSTSRKEIGIGLETQPSTQPRHNESRKPQLTVDASSRSRLHKNRALRPDFIVLGFNPPTEPNNHVHILYEKHLPKEDAVRATIKQHDNAPEVIAGVRTISYTLPGHPKTIHSSRDGVAPARPYSQVSLLTTALKSGNAPSSLPDHIPFPEALDSHDYSKGIDLEQRPSRPSLTKCFPSLTSSNPFRRGPAFNAH
ncbi:hypothetical protein CC78DRAFT_578880 [Lojkania enalia]|uniref:Uncharacterized protein n=1 Tax=Lojkania enalia TaxID=147567 RepID=A0A9P4KCJ6_9PLEO|nr:hypothetical protein CC78DRAFT_578880 [Didymosphaeria enalia]